MQRAAAQRRDHVRRVDRGEAQQRDEVAARPFAGEKTVGEADVAAQNSSRRSARQS